MDTRKEITRIPEVFPPPHPHPQPATNIEISEYADLQISFVIDENLSQTLFDVFQLNNSICTYLTGT